MKLPSLQNILWALLPTSLLEVFHFKGSFLTASFSGFTFSKEICVFRKCWFLLTLENLFEKWLFCGFTSSFICRLFTRNSTRTFYSRASRHHMPHVCTFSVVNLRIVCKEHCTKRYKQLTKSIVSNEVCEIYVAKGMGQLVYFKNQKETRWPAGALATPVSPSTRF